MIQKNQENNYSPLDGINAIIYIINLDGAIERRKSVEKELRKTNIPFQFIPAVDKATIDSLKHKVDNKYKRQLVSAEIACYLSHVKVKKEFLESSYDYAIIFEDDVELLEKFDETVKKAIKDNSSLQEKNQWDVLKISSHGKKKLIELREIDSNYALYGGSIAITALAAVWTRKGVTNFLKNTTKNDHVIITMPIDCALQHPWKYELKINNIVPHITRLQEFESQIGPSRKKRKTSFVRNMNYEISRSIPRLYFYLKTWLLR